jgi:hypothetical protein
MLMVNGTHEGDVRPLIVVAVGPHQRCVNVVERQTVLRERSLLTIIWVVVAVGLI